MVFFAQAFSRCCNRYAFLDVSAKNPWSNRNWIEFRKQFTHRFSEQFRNVKWEVRSQDLKALIFLNILSVRLWQNWKTCSWKSLQLFEALKKSQANTNYEPNMTLNSECPNLFDQFLVTDCPRPHPPPVTQTSGGMQVWQTVSSVRQRARNAEQITKKWGNSVHTPDIPRCFCCRLWCIQYINDVYMIYEYLLWCTWVYIYIYIIKKCRWCIYDIQYDVCYFSFIRHM